MYWVIPTLYPETFEGGEKMVLIFWLPKKQQFVHLLNFLIRPNGGNPSHNCISRTSNPGSQNSSPEPAFLLLSSLCFKKGRLRWLRSHYDKEIRHYRLILPSVPLGIRSKGCSPLTVELASGPKIICQHSSQDPNQVLQPGFLVSIKDDDKETEPGNKNKKIKMEILTRRAEFHTSGRIPHISLKNTKPQQDLTDNTERS